MSRALCLTALLLLVLPSSGGKIKHFVILMEENRSFDHMLGWMKNINPEVDGLTGKEYNLRDPFNASSTKYHAGTNAPYVAYFDPNHSLDGTTFEIFGAENHTGLPPNMVGFVAEAIREADKGEKFPADTVMQGFLPERLPVLSTLAQQGALFDKMHAALPGPTQPNRIFFLTCTSRGLVDNNKTALLLGLPQKTIFNSAREGGRTFGVYFHDASEAVFLDEFRTIGGLAHLHPFEAFERHVRDGSLPELVYINPRFYAELDNPAQDQHPVHDIRQGERLMKKVYDTLRQSQIWNETAIIYTYDEHGGYFDHVPTPVDGVPNPDGRDHKSFKFNRLGVRVPFVVVSPWIDANTTVHDPPAAQRPFNTSRYDHTSVHATIKKMWGLKDFLTKRDEWAGTFEHIFSRSEPRTDMPWEMPAAPESDDSTTAMRELQGHPTGLQLELAEYLGRLAKEEVPKHENLDQLAQWVERAMQKVFHHHTTPYPLKGRRGL